MGESIVGKPLLKKRVFPHPFPKTFGIYAVFNWFLEIGAEVRNWRMGFDEELPYVRTRARSLHFGHYGLMVGSLPSRALVQMSL